MPVTIKATELPDAQPERSTISWTIDFRFGVRWPAPASSAISQSGGDQATDAEVLVRDDTLFVELVKAGALSLSLAVSPRRGLRHILGG